MSSVAQQEKTVTDEFVDLIIENRGPQRYTEGGSAVRKATIARRVIRIGQGGCAGNARKFRPIDRRSAVIPLRNDKARCRIERSYAYTPLPAHHVIAWVIVEQAGIDSIVED